MKMPKPFRLKTLALAGTIGLATVACDPATQVAWIRGTGIVVGTVTGFGSIFVNGVEYDIDQAAFDIDGQTDFASASVAQQNLAVGMVVRLEATDHGDGTGTAARVIYDDAIQGPMTAPVAYNNDPNRMQFSVLGQTVIADQFTTVFDDMGFADLAQDLVVEVSGYPDANGIIHATRIARKGSLAQGAVVELHGQISNLNGYQFQLGQNSVSFTDQTVLLDLPNGLQNGLNVEVKGNYQADGSIAADRIEGEDDDISQIVDAQGEVELQGIVADFVSPSDFTVNGVRIDASGLTQIEQNALANGVQVEIKGSMVNKVLVAKSIELRGAEAEIKGRLVTADANAGFVEINFAAGGPTLRVLTTTESLFKDERMNASGAALTLSQIGTDLQNGVLDAQISIRRQGNDWVLVTLKLEDPLDEYEAKGVVEDVDPVARTINLFGLTLTLDPSASVAATFFDSLTIGSTKVELKDIDMDGDFDQVEIDAGD